MVPLIALAWEGGEELLRLLLGTSTVVDDPKLEACQSNERTKRPDDNDDPAPEL